MGKQRANRRKRREQAQNDQEAVLRLVEQPGEPVSAEPQTPGQPDPAGMGIRDGSGRAGIRLAAARRDPLVAAIAEPAVWRSLDAADINPILNDPEVFPWVAMYGMQSIDASHLIEDRANVLLMAEGGGIIFHQTEPSIYEVHTNFLRRYRGKYALAASRAAYRWMFTRTDCVILRTKVPANNKGAHLFCRLIGATHEFDRENCWPLLDGRQVGLSHWSLTYDAWVRQSPELIESGKAFHHRIEEEFARHNVARASHPDEDCHDLHAGACAEMIYGGQPDKAVILYNRWARFAGYRQIDLISHSPLLIDIGDALLQVGDRTFKAIKCRPPQQ